MSKNLVAKFGGTSVKNAESIYQVFNIVKSNPNIRIVVVSAIGGVTDLLLEYSYTSRRKRSRYIQYIKDIHINIVRDLDLPLAEVIEKKVSVLDFYKNKESLSLRDIDNIIALGEDLSSLIISHFFCSNNLLTHFFDIRRLLRTNSAYGRATPFLNEIQKNLHLLPEGLVVTQGFIGSDLNGHTTTLGRGGSDYSAALLAEALQSEELLIYKDVNGVCSIDPFIDSQAKLIPKISFQEMRDMANFGAKILHLSTLEPCFRSKTAIKILSTFNPYSEHTSITFDNLSLEKTRQILAITLRRKQALVSIRNYLGINKNEILDKVFSLLSEYEIVTEILTINDTELSFIVNSQNFSLRRFSPFSSNQRLICKLKTLAEIFIEEDLTLIAIIGRNLTVNGILPQILSLLYNFMFRLVHYEESNSSLGILVNNKDAEMIARILHQQLIIDHIQ